MKLLYVVPIRNSYSIHSENDSLPFPSRIKCSTFNLLAVILHIRTLPLVSKFHFSFPRKQWYGPKHLNIYSVCSIREDNSIYIRRLKSLSPGKKPKKKNRKLFISLSKQNAIERFDISVPFVYPVLYFPYATNYCYEYNFGDLILFRRMPFD